MDGHLIVRPDGGYAVRDDDGNVLYRSWSISDVVQWAGAHQVSIRPDHELGHA